LFTRKFAGMVRGMDNHAHPWTEAEDALLGTATDKVVALRIGRTRGAVKARRFASGIEPGRIAQPAAEPTPLEQLGRKIAAWRQKAGLTQAEAARQAGVDVSLWERYEAGVAEPKALRLKAIAAALRVTADRLLA
jgi:ribosome-binding protein aMBF1 (putative translation factor)